MSPPTSPGDRVCCVSPSAHRYDVRVNATVYRLCRLEWSTRTPITGPVVDVRKAAAIWRDPAMRVVELDAGGPVRVVECGHEHVEILAHYPPPEMIR